MKTIDNILILILFIWVHNITPMIKMLVPNFSMYKFHLACNFGVSFRGITQLFLTLHYVFSTFPFLYNLIIQTSHLPKASIRYYWEKEGKRKRERRKKKGRKRKDSLLVLTRVMKILWYMKVDFDSIVRGQSSIIF